MAWHHNAGAVRVPGVHAPKPATAPKPAMHRAQQPTHAKPHAQPKPVAPKSVHAKPVAQPKHAQSAAKSKTAVYTEKHNKLGPKTHTVAKPLGIRH